MKQKINVAVLVSGCGTNLQALIDAQNSGIIKNASIKVVISNKSDAFALERAKKANIEPLYIAKNKGYDPNFESKLIEELNKRNIQLIVLAGFMAILSKNFTDTFSDRIINIHPSLIPSFCGDGFYGLKVHEKALEYGVKVSGATVHFVNEVPDGGKIIMQKAVPVKKGDTPEILQKRIMQQAEWKILPLSVELVAKNMLKQMLKENL